AAHQALVPEDTVEKATAFVSVGCGSARAIAQGAGSRQITDKTVAAGDVTELPVISDKVAEQALRPGQFAEHPAVSGDVPQQALVGDEAVHEPDLVRDLTVAEQRLTEKVIGDITQGTFGAGQISEQSVRPGDVAEQTVIARQIAEQALIADDRIK
ncbi:hypothetical protein, partial [Roseivivax isoporae]|uniref:hypothetical protein n=1 Tax=Roseivivax isoporae TaxID=591206 RepID=UPI0005C249B2